MRMVSRRRRRRLAGYALYALVVTLLWPSDALAWGPAAHVDYGLEVLKNIAILSPFLRGLLGPHADDYLYGCCAADIVVGKNFAKELHHCHNWQVALRMLESCEDDRQRALTFGFLTHLSADIVAHNFFVPYKSVEAFRARTAKHSYWELRWDREVLARPGVWDTFRRITRRKFPEHDAFLGEQLRSGSRLFSFGTSRKIFSSYMLLTRLERWQRMVAGVARRSPLRLDPAEVKEFRTLSVNAIFGFLIDQDDSRTVTVDASGARSLRVARDLRGELRGFWKDGGVKDERWPALAHDLRGRFRDGLYGRLEVPDTGALVRKYA